MEILSVKRRFGIIGPAQKNIKLIDPKSFLCLGKYCQTQYVGIVIPNPTIEPVESARRWHPTPKNNPCDKFLLTNLFINKTKNTE